MKNNRGGWYGVSRNGIHFCVSDVMTSLYKRGVIRKGGIASTYRIQTTEENGVKLVDMDDHCSKDAKLSNWMPTDYAVFEAYTKSF